MQRLMGHHNNPIEASPEVTFDIKDNTFSVKCSFIGEFNINKDFNPQGFDNWNLWDFDVFELFLTRSPNNTPYLEIQVSPLKQKFALLIEKPREKFDRFDPQTLEVDSKYDGKSWEMECRLNLEEIPGDGTDVFGDIHFCLGSQSKRHYYGLNINKDEKPDFHRPDLFIKLGEMK